MLILNDLCLKWRRVDSLFFDQNNVLSNVNSNALFPDQQSNLFNINIKNKVIHLNMWLKTDIFFAVCLSQQTPKTHTISAWFSSFAFSVLSLQLLSAACFCCLYVFSDLACSLCSVPFSLSIFFSYATVNRPMLNGPDFSSRLVSLDKSGPLESMIRLPSNGLLFKAVVYYLVITHHGML